MNTFMITIQLPKELTKEFISLIPKQRARINELMDQGTILQYALAVDHSLLWITVSAPTEMMVNDILSSFPLIRFMEPEFYKLAFQNSISTELPKIILN